MTDVAFAGADLEDPVRAETPEPDDRRFQDDDGTWYIWDALLRKFVEEVILSVVNSPVCNALTQTILPHHLLIYCSCPSYNRWSI